MTDNNDKMRDLLKNQSFTHHVVKTHSEEVEAVTVRDNRTREIKTIPMSVIREAQAEFINTVIDAFLECTDKVGDPRYTLNILQVFDIEMAIIVSAIVRHAANDGLDPKKNLIDLISFVAAMYQECLAHRVAEGHAHLYEDTDENGPRTVN